MGPEWTGTGGDRLEIAMSLGYVPGREGSLPLDSTAAPGIGAALATLRDPAAPAEARHQAWSEFVAWLYREHAWAIGRLHALIRQRGLAGRIEPGDVLAAFCLEVQADPRRLGKADVPSRSWLWWRLADTLRGFAAASREPPRALPAADPDAAPLPEPAYPEGREPPGFGDPGSLAATRELTRELDAALARLAAENPDQHAALLLKAELSYEDVGRRLGKSENTVKSLVKRARDLIRARVLRLGWSF